MNKIRHILMGCTYCFRAVTWCAFLLCLSGCAKVSTHLEGGGDSDCQQFWQSMDMAISSAGVEDGFAARVDGFDYLRVNRFLMALGAEVDSTRKERALLEQMRMLDLQRRYLELEFLSDQQWIELTQQGWPVDEGVFKRKVASCSAELMQTDRAKLQDISDVINPSFVDQDYSMLYRTLGLYPLAQFVVGGQIQSYQDEHPITIWPSPPIEGERILEPPQGPKMSPRRMKLLLRNSRVKPFLTFRLAERDLLSIAQFYAPAFRFSGDSFGRIIPSKEGGWQVDEHNPVVYYYPSQAIVQGVPALQINYVVWFLEKRAPAPWYTEGHLDGITIRVTLDWQGRPLVYDSIGNCGCFYFGLHNESLVELDTSKVTGFQPKLVTGLPVLGDSEHLNVHVATGSNEVFGVSLAKLTGAKSPYALVPYETLERFSDTLPQKFFNGSGVVVGTNRFERYFLFPMGIPSVGSMRQRGRQPITLVGRAYFDDPHLYDNVLLFKESLPPKRKLIKKGKKKQSSLQRRVESSKSMGQAGGSGKEKYFRKRGMDM